MFERKDRANSEEHLSGTPLLGRVLALFANMILGLEVDVKDWSIKLVTVVLHTMAW
jgi:hypothetical protein